MFALLQLRINVMILMGEAHRKEGRQMPVSAGRMSATACREALQQAGNTIIVYGGNAGRGAGAMKRIRTG